MNSVAYNRDCLEGMKEIPDATIDLTVTSPPYDDLRKYNGFSFDWRETIEQLYRVTKNGGVVVWIVSDQTINGSETGTSFRQVLYAMECGFLLHDTMIWEKETCVFTKPNRYYPVFEYMFILSKGVPKTFNPIKDRINISVGRKVCGTQREKDGRMRRLLGEGKEIEEFGTRYNVWQINSEKNNTTGHPAVFPVSLAQDHIRSWSNEGDLVLDPFLGSGTTRIAAYDLNRSFIGYEISKEYFNAQEERFIQHSSQISMFLEEETGCE